MCVSVCLHVCLCSACGGRRRTLTPLELELETGQPPRGCRCWDSKPGLLEEQLAPLATEPVSCTILRFSGCMLVPGRKQGTGWGTGGDPSAVNSPPRWDVAQGVCWLGLSSVPGGYLSVPVRPEQSGFQPHVLKILMGFKPPPLIFSLLIQSLIVLPGLALIWWSTSLVLGIWIYSTTLALV